MARPRTGEYFNCKSCGVEFYRQQIEIKRGRVHYCSSVCSGKAHRGKNNSQWLRGYFITDNGYKKIRVGNKYVFEHRYVVEQHSGEKLDNKLDVHHIDGDKLNNHIDNLIVLTKSQHAIAHNRRGENNNKTKLSEDQVIEIREKYAMGTSSIKLGKLFNVHSSNIRYIVNRTTWKHI